MYHTCHGCNDTMAISPVGLSIVQTDRHRQLAYINIAQRDISKSRNLAVMVSGASRDSQETNSDRAPTQLHTRSFGRQKAPSPLCKLAPYKKTFTTREALEDSQTLGMLTMIHECAMSNFGSKSCARNVRRDVVDARDNGTTGGARHLRRHWCPVVTGGSSLVIGG